MSESNEEADVATAMLLLEIDSVTRVATSLGVEISYQQAASIAKNFLVPRFVDRWPLSPDDHAIAVRIRCQQLKVHSEGKISDEDALADARRMVAFGEQGETALQKIGSASGCLSSVVVLLAILALIVTFSSTH